MAHEKKVALRKKIQHRRGDFLSAVILTPAIDAFLAYLFSGLEKKLDPANLPKLSEKEKKELGKMFASVTDKFIKNRIDVALGNPDRKWAFDIAPHQFLRYCLYAPVAIPTLFIGNALVKPLYEQLLPANGTIQELEKMDERESYLQSTSLNMMILMLLVTVELTTDFKIPKMLFLMLLSNAMLSAKAETCSSRSRNNTVYIENTSLQNNQSVFFKPNTKNQEMCNLMVTGKINPALKGDGFFVRDTAQKGYDLKARLGDKRAYFTKDVDAQGETTYLQLENKPKRPGKIA